MKEFICKYRSCLISLFSFESICVEKVASMLFKSIFIIMSILLIMNLYITTTACVTNTITFSLCLYNVIFDILLFVIELCLLRLLLEIPVVLNKILKALNSHGVSYSDEKELN